VDFHDMEMRVFNSSPCPVRHSGTTRPREHQGIWQGPLQIVNGSAQGSWPYGTLYILRDENDLRQLYATFGDMTLAVTDEQANHLVALAIDRSVYRQR